MNDRGLVDVPENAVRSESLAFGLSAPQLGILGAALGFAAVANFLPLWLPAKVLLILVGVVSVVLVAILPIRGEHGPRRHPSVHQARVEQVPPRQVHRVEANTLAELGTTVACSRELRGATS